MDALVNFGYSTVAVAPTPSTSGSALTVATGQGSRFPTAPFDVTLVPVNTLPTIANAEIARCVNITGDVLTLIRAQYGTTAQSVEIGWAVDNAVTANLLSQLLSNAESFATSAVNTETTRAENAEALKLAIANNLSDVASPVRSLMNVGASWAYLPTNWDTAWVAAKAASASTPAWALFLGDSITFGQNASNSMTTTWAELLRTSLLTKYSLYGDFYPMWAYCASYNTAFAGTAPFANLSSSLAAVEAGYGRAIIINGGVYTTFTTPGSNVVAMDLVYLDYATASGAGAMTYSVDGGTAVTVATTNSSSPTTAQVKKVSITGLTAGTHTLKITSGTTSNNCIILGVSCYASTTSGLGFVRNAYPGMRGVDLATAAGGNTGAGSVFSSPPDKISLWQGQSPGGSSPTTPTGFGFPTQPSLAIINLAVNDTSLGSGYMAYQSALVRMVRALRRGQNNCSIAFLCNNFPDDINSDNPVAGRGQLYPTYKNIMRQVADMYNCAFVDIDSKWGEYGLTDGFQTSGNLHPTDAGYADIATVLEGIL